MRQNGTDLMAVACILGGGVVAGGVTLALAASPELPSLECATTVAHDADVVASLGDGGLVVVTPDVRVREMRRCTAGEGVSEADRVTERLQEMEDRIQERQDRARERAARAREMAQLADGFTIELPDRVFEFRDERPEGFEGIDSFEDAVRMELQILRAMDRRLEGLDEELEDEIRTRLDQKIAEIEERLARMDGEGGR